MAAAALKDSGVQIMSRCESFLIILDHLFSGKIVLNTGGNLNFFLEEIVSCSCNFLQRFIEAVVWLISATHATVSPYLDMFRNSKYSSQNSLMS